MTHLRINGRKIISRHFQLVRISYQKLDFHGIGRFSSVPIINNFNAWKYTGTMNTKSLLTDPTKKTPTLALVIFVGSVKRKPK
jgi:hypothetical protein